MKHKTLNAALAAVLLSLVAIGVAQELTLPPWPDLSPTAWSAGGKKYGNHATWVSTESVEYMLKNNQFVEITRSGRSARR